MAMNYNSDELTPGRHEITVNRGDLTNDISEESGGGVYDVDYMVVEGSWVDGTPMPFTKDITIHLTYDAGAYRHRETGGNVLVEFSKADFGAD